MVAATADRAEADQQATIEFLSRPQSYGIAGTVERIDTHAAVVFLAGDRAYKLKRAVKYPYLDFSSIARRKAVCEAELALNRRTAPALYLEVRSVNRTASGALGFADGEPVDWLVVMRRFAAGCLLEAVAESGGLSPGLVRDLADAIAAFHDGAEVVITDDGARRVGRVIDSNRASMAQLPDDALAPDDCAQLHARSIAELERIAPLLDARGAAGHVRHCHGDLHLANICLWHGRPTLFDCLEFDADLATTDVLYDLAFLVMDLWERDRRAEASLVFNRYLDMRDEGDGIAAFPLFLSLRAAIRALVGATAAARQDDAAKRAAKLERARDYLRRALGFLGRDPPRLIAIGGLSGTGKSTLAACLAPDIAGAPGARWLRSDVLRKRMAGVAPEARLPACAYSRESSAAVYARLLGAAAQLLAGGRAVIVDAVFADPQDRRAIAAVAQAAGVDFAGLWLEAPVEVLTRRVSERTGDASDADGTVVARQAGYPIGELGNWHRIDAAATREAIHAAARDALGLGPPAQERAAST